MSDFIINSKQNKSNNDDELIYKNINKVDVDDLTQSSDTAYNTDIITPLDDFINKNRVPIGDKTFTHTIFLETTKIIFKIDDNDYEKYINLYTKEITNNKKFGNLNLMEKPRDIGYLCLDFDFKYKNNEKIFDNTNHIKNIVLIINKIVSKYYKIKKNNTVDSDIDNDDNDDNDINDVNEEENLNDILKAYVTVKNEPYYDRNREYYSYGFHIQYPNLILSVVDRFFIFDEMKRCVEKNKIFDDIENKVLNYNDIMDKSIIKSNQWFNYGSGKILNGKTYYYKLFTIYDINLNELNIEIPIKKLVNLLAIRHIKSRTVIVKDDNTIKDKLKKIKEKYMHNDIKQNIGQNNKQNIKPNNLFVDNPKNIKKINLSDDEKELNDNKGELNERQIQQITSKKELLDNKNTNIEN